MKNLRLLVVNNKADQVSVVGGTIALPGQFDPCTASAVGLELQDCAFTWGHSIKYVTVQMCRN